MKVFFSPQFLRFLAAGGIAALVNFTSRIFYDVYLSFSAAIVLAYLTGMVTAYLLNRLFVFEPGMHPLRREVGYFVLVNLLAVLQTWAVSMVLVLWVLPEMEYRKELAHFTGILVPAFTSFIGHKFLTFRRLEVNG